MKKILSIFFLLAIPPVAFSQQFTASVISNAQRAFAGMDNVISCTVQGYPCQSIKLISDGRTIKREGCNYIFHPNKPADSEIKIFYVQRNKRKSVGHFFISVREMRTEAAVDGVMGGEISKSALAAQMGIACSVVETGFELKCVIDSFTVTILRKDSVLYHKQFRGNLFSEETRAFFRSLESSDIVLFSQIIYFLPDQKRKRARPIEFIIK